ncbi:MAG: hypothetical protein XFASWVDF_002762, partial [Candidatus Fervidibacter sp.]
MAHEVHAHSEVHHEPKSFWTKYIFSQDAKIIGIQYLITAFVMGFIALVLSWLMRLQLGFPGKAFPWLEKLLPNAAQGGILNQDFYLAAVTIHGTIMIFFFITAAGTGGFSNFLIPLQIGARDMAFPFVNMLSYWVYLAACIVLVASFFV